MQRIPTIFAVLALAGAQAGAQVERFHGHRAVRVTVSTARQLMTVRGLANDILSCSGSGIGSFEIRVAPDRYAALVASGIPHEVTIPDLQVHLDQIWADDARIRAGDDPSWFATYRSLGEIVTRMQTLAAGYPDLASFSNVGTSYLGVPIPMIRITGPGPTATRPAIIVQACQHAREWVTPMTAMYIADRFIETYATDTRIRNIVDRMEFYIIPVVNPDGYEYSRIGGNSQWRKNRHPFSGGLCDGVDLNRNWGYMWGYDNSGSGPTSCSETYRGPAAFSEPEIAGIKTLIDTLAGEGRLRSHWDIHSSAQRFMSPWGYTPTPPAALPLMNQVGLIVRNSIAAAGGGIYPYGPSNTIIYPANGVTPDYVYGAHNIPAWTLEMSGGGFQPPAAQILPIASHGLAGFVPFAEFFIPCYANCDRIGGLTPNDFQCFLNAYAAGQSTANCDNSTTSPVLTANDFQCFLNAYAAGCP